MTNFIVLSLICFLIANCIYWSSSHQIQRDIADNRERIAKLEVKLEYIESKSSGIKNAHTM